MAVTSTEADPCHPTPKVKKKMANSFLPVQPVTWLHWRGQWALCQGKASTHSVPRWWEWNQRRRAASRTSDWASCQFFPPSNHPAGRPVLLPLSLWTEQKNQLLRKSTLGSTIKCFNVFTSTIKTDQFQTLWNTCDDTKLLKQQKQTEPLSEDCSAMRHVRVIHHDYHHTPNQEAWLSSSCSRGSAILISSGMAGELYPNTNPKLMGPRTDANVARYNFLFFTLLQRETEQPDVRTEVSLFWLNWYLIKG